MTNVRAAAANVLFQVVDKGQSLSTTLPNALETITPRDYGLLQEMCYGVLRYLPRLESVVNQLMDSPLKGKQRVFHHLILVGIYQLSFMRIPPHAAVGETVEGTRDLKGPKLKGLINGVLRNYQRNQADLDAQAISHDAGKYGHPKWLLTQIKNSYPDTWQAIVEANNQKAPMWLRVNTRHHTRDAYCQLLDNEDIAYSLHSEALDAIELAHPMDVYTLPGFADGWVSVQDAAAQLAYYYLAPRDGEHILDCCCAPGGKTAHILEKIDNAHVTAIDSDKNRLTRVHENLARLELNKEHSFDVTVLCQDARSTLLEKTLSDDAQSGRPAQFDRILLDAPCSATGVIRRHPDIKWLRRAEDITALTQLQSDIIDTMWQQLKPGGTLVYATCSILAQENHMQVEAFLQRTQNAKLAGSDPSKPGRQILPSEHNMDGFYYAVLMKQA